MSAAHRIRGVVAAAAAACAAGLFVTGAGAAARAPGHAGATAAPNAEGTGPRPPGNAGVAPSAPAGVRAVPGAGTAGVAPGGVVPGGTSAASGSPRPGAPYAGRARVFGLVEAGATPEVVRFAPARKAQPGGPETVHPVDVGRYVTLPLAPGAVIRASAPIVNEGVTDWVRGVRLTPERFWSAMRRLQARSHPFRERSHMFELWFDRQGRITRMQHYFSP